MATYTRLVKDEEATYVARNANFIKNNPILESLAFVNLNDETQYWKYTDYITMLEKDDNIEAHIKMLDFLSEQLRYRLRIKSNNAIECRENVKILMPIFQQIHKENQDSILL